MLKQSDTIKCTQGLVFSQMLARIYGKNISVFGDMLRFSTNIFVLIEVHLLIRMYCARWSTIKMCIECAKLALNNHWPAHKRKKNDNYIQNK